MKIVTLLPSATEIIYALGLGHTLVGRSHACNYPNEVTKLPVLTSDKLTVCGSKKIDEQISKFRDNQISVYNVEIELLEKLKPDLIITQSQCDLCAVSFDELKHSLKSTSLMNSAMIVNLAPNRYEDIFTDIDRISMAIDPKENPGIQERAARLKQDITSRIESITKKTLNFDYHKSVFCIEWLDPLMNAGNWIPTLISKAGGIIPPPYNKIGAHSHHIEWQDLTDVDTEVILIIPCGFTIDQTREEQHLLTKHPKWKELHAVRNHQVYIINANQYFSRPSPRICEAVEITAEILYPEVFPRKYNKEHWQLF